jgi:hypothetical protein
MSALASSFSARLLTVLSAAVGVWALLLSVPEVMKCEHFLQQWARQLVKPTHEFQQGNGSHAQPYSHARWEPVAHPHAPFIVVMGEDPERIFDSNPLSASDCAVLIDTLSALGVKEMVLSTPLMWQEEDPFALSALEIVMDQFPTCLTTADLQRAVEDQEMPEPMKRASVAWSMVREPKQDLLVMNALTFPQTQLGREYTWAGFSAASGGPHEKNAALLLARWGERVVFSSSFLAVLLHHEIHPKELQIEPGQGIYCPRTGHFWGIDRFGRYTIRGGDAVAPDLQATQLIRAEESTKKLVAQHRAPLHVMAQQGEGAAAEREIRLLKSLRQEPLMRDLTTWSRLPLAAEFGILVICAAQGLLMMNFPLLIRMAALLLVAAQWWMALSMGETWIPLMPIVVALTLAWWLSPRRALKRKNRRKKHWLFF